MYGRGTQKCLRLPLTVSVLRRLRPRINFGKHNDRALWAILCVGVFTLARIGELTPGTNAALKVLRRSVSMKGEEGALFLVGTKTDREHKGVSLRFFRNGTNCCPFSAMSAYLTGSGGAK